MIQLLIKSNQQFGIIRRIRLKSLVLTLTKNVFVQFYRAYDRKSNTIETGLHFCPFASPDLIQISSRMRLAPYVIYEYMCIWIYTVHMRVYAS